MIMNKIQTGVRCENCHWVGRIRECDRSLDERKIMIEFSCPGCGKLLAVGQIEITDIEVLIE